MRQINCRVKVPGFERGTTVSLGAGVNSAFMTAFPVKPVRRSFTRSFTNRARSALATVGETLRIHLAAASLFIPSLRIGGARLLRRSRRDCHIKRNEAGQRTHAACQPRSQLVWIMMSVHMSATGAGHDFYAEGAGRCVAPRARLEAMV